MTGGVTNARCNTGAGDDGQDIARMLVKGGMWDAGMRETASLDGQHGHGQ